MAFNIELSSEVSSAIISGTVSVIVAIISFCANKYKTESEIKKAKLEAKTEIKKLKMEIDQANKIRAEDIAMAQEADSSAKYSNMHTAIQQFVEIPDVNTKNAAVASINSVLSVEKGTVRNLLIEVKDVISKADAFDGPNQRKLNPLLEKIRIQSGK